MFTIRIIILNLFIIVLRIYILEFHRLSVFVKNYELMMKINTRYTRELDKNKKIIHNFRNQLIVINGYVNNEDVKLKSYIYEIIGEQKNIKNDNLIYSINKLPKFIKCLLFYKFSEVEDKISININIYNSLNKLKKLSIKQKKDILCIIGILVDNAIEATIISKKKELMLDFYLNKKTFILKIINTYAKKPNIDKIKEKGYSTKGLKRGYGLSIVEDIIKRNDNMNILYDIKDENFCVNFYVGL